MTFICFASPIKQKNLITSERHDKRNMSVPTYFVYIRNFILWNSTKKKIINCWFLQNKDWNTKYSDTVM